MTTIRILSQLRRRGVSLWAEGDRLRYRAAPGVVTSELRQELRMRKPEILAILRKAHDAQASNRLPVLPVPLSGDLPLSFAQQRLWFLDQLEPGSPLYNVPEAMSIGPGLDVDVLQKSLDTLVRRQQVLRTTFGANEGIPRQVVAQPRPVEMRRIDLSDWSGRDRDGEVQRRLAEEARRPFRLSRDLMLRAMLLKVDGGAHVFLLVTHHIVCDGWSMGVLFDELAALYEGFSTATEPVVPELKVQYVDYVHWQQQRLQGEVLDSMLAYWKRHLGNSPPTLELPTDYPRPSVQSHHGASRSFTIPADLSHRLKQLTLEAGATTFMTLFTAFQVLLYRYSGQDDIVVGSPAAVYNRFELMPLVGFWVNTLALRVDLSGSPTFRQLLARVRNMTLEAFDHQELPFEKLVVELHPDRDLTRNPLFQVMFVLQVQHKPSQKLRRTGLTINPIEIDTATSKFDLTLSMAEVGDHLEGSFEYRTDLFDSSRMARMVGHLQCLLTGITADPDRPIDELPILSENERHQILVEWNSTTMKYPRDRCVHQLFEVQAQKTPTAVAVESDDEQLTYRELDCRSNQLAHYLRRQGAVSGARVGISMEPSAEMLIAVLGICKAGCSYVPLDPTYPTDRLACMLEDANVQSVLTQERLLPGLAPHVTKMVCVDAERKTISSETAERVVSPGSTSESAAYLIFTSGSTGRPKAVQVSHRALTNLLCAMKETPGFTSRDVLLAITSLSFDIAALELFLPLIVGGRTVIVGREVGSDGTRLGAHLVQHGATVMQGTPSTWRLLIESGWTGHRPLKVLCGGEVLPRDLADALLERARSVWNMYGPTETTVWSSTKEILPGDQVSIGRPIANTEVYILDSRLQPVPVGVVGELCIGGHGLANGYFNRPELTAEKFIPHPFKPVGRLYRTGDLARYQPDGEIDCLGRLNGQVKVRGFRIELGEIESVMLSHGGVRQAVAVARDDHPGNAQLVGYFISSGEVVTPGELRDLLRRRLPEYMVPSAFVELEQFPLTVNGKIDRRLLPPLGDVAREGAESYVAPRDITELRLVRLWEKVIGRRPIGVRDDFFAIGGHSLLAARLFAAMQSTLGVNLPLATLFGASTVEELARLLRQENWSPSWASLVPIRTTGSKPPFFCVHAAEGNVLLYQDLARYLGDDQPVFGLQARGLDGTPGLTTVEEMAASYVGEIKAVQPAGRYRLGGYLSRAEEN